MKRYPTVYAKVGTVPKSIILRSRKPFAVGDRIEYRLKDAFPMGWERGIVTSVEPLKLDRL